MPKREIVLSNGVVCARNIVNIHPNGEEFLPEKFVIPAEGERGSRIYELIAEIIENISANKRAMDHTPQEDPDAHGVL